MSAEMQYLAKLELSSGALFEIAANFEEKASVFEASADTEAAKETLPVILAGILMDKAEAGKKGAETFFRELDVNGDGSVSKIEFRQMMRSA